jgi:hypothetical protein
MQSFIELFNEKNPSGNVADSPLYRTILMLAVVISFVVAVKRFWVGLYLGQQTFARYADELAKLMKKTLLVGKVAVLAREIENHTLNARPNQNVTKTMVNAGFTPFNEEEDGEGLQTPRARDKNVVDLDGIHESSSRNVRITELLGAWEEPEDYTGKGVS